MLDICFLGTGKLFLFFSTTWPLILHKFELFKENSHYTCCEFTAITTTFIFLFYFHCYRVYFYMVNKGKY